MRAPKHLWSGDWERESAAVADDLASLEELPRLEAEPEREAPPAQRPASAPRPHTPRRSITWPALSVPSPSRRVQRAAALAAVVMLALAAAGYGLAALVGSSGSPDTPAANSPGATMIWRGMEVESINPGRVVVATVAAGSQGERSGLEPGDVLLAIDSRALGSTGDISKAIFAMQSGDVVQIEVGRGSTVFITNATLGAPPAKYP